jgi:hypothetical protein
LLMVVLFAHDLALGSSICSSALSYRAPSAQ